MKVRLHRVKRIYSRNCKIINVTEFVACNAAQMPDNKQRQVRNLLMQS